MGLLYDKLNGAAVLNMEGSEKLRELAKMYMKKNGIHPNKNVLNESWYKELKQGLFHPEYEGVYWSRAKIVRHH